MGEVFKMPQYEPERDIFYGSVVLDYFREERLKARARGEPWAQLKPTLTFPMSGDQLLLPFETIILKI
jgi:hypothetical protein